MDIRYLLWIIDVFAAQIIIQRRPSRSGTSIAPYFPFRRIKIINQRVLADVSEARIQVKPDKRFQPCVIFAAKKASGVHSWSQRTVRDLNLATAKVLITCRYRKLFCPHCQHISNEDLDLFYPYLRVTTRLAL
jgi:transposase